jgi:hypothetical protein
MKIFSPSITGSLNMTGSLIITGSFRLEPTDANASEVFLIKNSVGENLFIVSQSGVVQFATQSADPTGSTNAGTFWFTSSSFFVGLE